MTMLWVTPVEVVTVTVTPPAVQTELFLAIVAVHDVGPPVIALDVL
jgi:hypothetical protein